MRVARAFAWLALVTLLGPLTHAVPEGTSLPAPSVSVTAHVASWGPAAAAPCAASRTAEQGPADPAWNAVDDFVVQYYGYEEPGSTFADLGASAFDVVILDHARWSPTGERPLTPQEVLGIKYANPDQPKHVLAYVAIAEASDWRWFWNDDWGFDQDGEPLPGTPAWLGPENPNWPGSYRTRYWHQEWQDILFGQIDAWVDRILGSCFDGVMLDVVDTFYYWSEAPNAELSSVEARAEMADLVGRLKAYGNLWTPDRAFAVVPNNAERLAYEPGYLETVDAILTETLWFKNDVPRDPERVDHRRERLDLFRDAGNPVMNIEYSTTRATVEASYALAQAAGYSVYVTDNLGHTTIHAGYEPT